MLDDKGITGAGFSDYMEVSPPTVSNWRKGLIPHASSLLKISIYFHVSPHWLLNGQGQKHMTVRTSRALDS